MSIDPNCSGRADEVDDSCPTSHKSSIFSRAVEDDPRGQVGATRVVLPPVQPTGQTASLRPEYPVGVRLAEVLERTGARLADPAGSAGSAVDVVLSGVTLRAQDVRPGDLFAALPGSRMHGATFAGDAVSAGAAAVLTDPAGLLLLGDLSIPVLIAETPRALLGSIARAVYGDPSGRLAVVGITGTSGKTTTCYLLEAALAADGSKTGLIGTVQTRIDGAVAPSALTTPEAPDLQALFAVMAERGVTVVAMEVSSHALSLGRVSGTSFAVGAFTNLSQDHLDFHGDMEGYFAAKSLLFDGRSGRHVIDIDDKYGARLAASHPAALTVSAAGKPASWSVVSVQISTTGIQHVTLAGPAGPVSLELALPGAFNVSNAAMAMACVDALGRDVQQAADALAGVVVPGRMERVDAGQDFLAVVDYAHKPAALAAVLDAIAEGLTGRLIVVVGAGGDRDTGKRPVMGAEAVTRADLLIVTDDNPRSEEPALIRAQLLAGALAPEDYSVPGIGRAEVLEIGDRRAAIRAAVQAAGPGDAVVIAGKGHELGQEIAGVKHPFSDRDELLAALTAADPDGQEPADRPTNLLRVSAQQIHPQDATHQALPGTNIPPTDTLIPPANTLPTSTIPPTDMLPTA
jgi:UDP-N-acetylmuramoyl-L-alanyl-D-glutamate--2,6-diaminopimelate ligase